MPNLLSLEWNIYQIQDCSCTKFFFNRNKTMLFWRSSSSIELMSRQS